MKKVSKNWKLKTNGRMWKSEIWKVQLEFSQFLTAKKKCFTQLYSNNWENHWKYHRLSWWNLIWKKEKVDF
jgi:hypothetical protein